MKIRLIRDPNYPREGEGDYGAMDFFIWCFDKAYMEWRWMPRFGTTQQVWRWVERRVNDETQSAA